MIKNKNIREAMWGLLFVAPTIIGLIVLNIIPIIQTMKLSFFKSGDFGRGDIFIGLENYRRLFSDAQVWSATWNTVKYTLLVVPITVGISLILATLLNTNIKGKHLYRTIYFLPMVAAPAAVTMVWKWLFNTDFGLINFFLGKIGIGKINWLEDPNIALYSIALIGIWSAIGYNMILLLAGLQEIPKDYYESAKIDGASSIKQFFSITIPLLSPTLFFVVVTSIISSMQVFDSIYMIVGPSSPAYDKTVSLVYLFYNNSFKYADRGYGSAIIMLLLALILIITVIQMKVQKRWVHYN
ncbi:carbohydrate ABC transporter permease [Streptococcus pasteurianus]|uniref:carbohydrate ABC transporter permease n=1 Tax=Streptococcus pasteurianus TaxID=197614 RepID=UPI0020BF8FBE|nr:sugar ABC transporter permease [Streptococcus pasteurianus]WCQ69475.1 sugar ABC transporter permease [Streptococcus pasteurianus]WCQ69480.1 sugar ABC transporter permease [Streptococcus pasteurianus]